MAPLPHPYKNTSFTGTYPPREYDFAATSFPVSLAPGDGKMRDPGNEVDFAAVLVRIKLGLFPEIESEFRETDCSLHPPKKEYLSIKGFKYAKRIGR